MALTYKDLKKVEDEDVQENHDFEDVESDDEKVEFMENIFETFTELQEYASECISFEDDDDIQALASHTYNALNIFSKGILGDKDLRDRTDVQDFVKKLKTYNDGVL